MIVMTQGTRVTYVLKTKFKDRKVYGIIKSFADDPKHAFVVFKCNDDWKNYQNYTAQRTPIKHLKPGWI